MKEYLAETGGRYTYADDVLNLQQLALSMTALLSECSDMIISGCEITGATIAPGYLWLGGKVRYYEGCVAATFPYYIYERNITEAVTYAKQVNKRGRVNYVAVGGTEVPGTQDPITGGLPCYIEITREYAPRLREKFFGRYAVLLESLQPQRVRKDLSLMGGLTAEKNIESKAAFIVSGSNGYSLRHQVTPAGKVTLGLYKDVTLLCDISLTEDGTLTFTKNGVVVGSLSEQGLTCKHISIGSGQIGSLALVGNQLFNVGDNNDEGAVKINYEGYEQGASYYRKFEIYDGKRCSEPLFHVNGATRTTTVNNLLCVSYVTQGIVLRHPYLKSDTRLTGALAWRDSNDEQIAAIGFASEDSFDLSFSNSIGNISLQPKDSLNVQGVLKVKGIDIASTYATQTALASGLESKVDKIIGKGLSTEDFSTECLKKLDAITTGSVSSDSTGYVTASDVRAALAGKLDIAANLSDVEDVAAARSNLNVLSHEESSALYFQISRLLSEVISLSPDEINGLTPEQIIALKEQKQQKVLDNIGAEKRGSADLRLAKAQNFADLTDKNRARQNLEVYSVTEIDNLLSGKLNAEDAYVGVSFTAEHRTKLEGIKTGNFAGKNAEGVSVSQVEGYAMISAIRHELDKKADRLMDGYSVGDKGVIASNIDVYTKADADKKFAAVASQFQDYVTHLVSQGKTTLEAQQILRDKFAAAGSKDLADNYLRKDSRLTDLAITKVEDKRQICNKLGAAYSEDYQTKIPDTGWLQMSNSGSGTDTRNLFVRQIGNIVSIQGSINTARRDGSNWGGTVAVIPNKIDPPKYSVRCTAANWNDDAKFNRGCTFTIYGGGRNIQLYESGMYNIDVEINFTYFV